MQTFSLIYSGEGIYFVHDHPEPGKNVTVLFHFNFKSATEIVLNYCKDGSWSHNVALKDDNVKEVFGKPFILTIQLLKNKTDEFLVFLNQEYLTTYKCPAYVDITQTKYIGFSTGLRVCASNLNFESEKK